MKKTVKVLSAVALIFMIAACSKNIETPEVQDNNQPEITGGKVTESLIAKTENDADTKMAVDGLTSGSNYSWSVGTDKIAAFVTKDDANYTKVESGAYNGSFSLTYDEGYERGGFAVYPYEFAKSYSSAGGLVVTYPESYDISDYITNDYLSEKVYDVHSVYFPMPMIATSTSGNNNLEFYSIGAMVRVKVSNIPAGTKVLYITFNQRVTGDFTIALPNPGTSVVSATSGTTTVAYRIAAEESEGLTEKQAENAIVLYIPVPVATDLSIASTTTTKTTVRNGGKSFAVDAITYTGNKGYFQITDGTYVFAPGNLLAYNNAGTIEYSFEDPLISTRGEMNDDPHMNSVKGGSIARSISPLLSDLGDKEFLDVFTWDVLRAMVGDLPLDPDVAGGYLTDNGKYQWDDSYYATHDFYNFATNSITVAGQNWEVPSESFWESFTRDYQLTASERKFNVNRTGTLGRVRGVSTKYANVKVDVSGNDARDGYAIWPAESSTCVPGRLFFPDGYVDQTDLLNELDNSSRKTGWSLINNTIDYSILEEMMSKGAVFMNSTGMFIFSNEDPTKWTWSFAGGNDRCFGYYSSCTMSFNASNYEFVDHDSNTFGLRGFNMGDNGGASFATRPLDRAYLVRLVRKVE